MDWLLFENRWLSFPMGENLAAFDINEGMPIGLIPFPVGELLKGCNGLFSVGLL
jgi:hypothetical protein